MENSNNDDNLPCGYTGGMVCEMCCGYGTCEQTKHLAKDEEEEGYNLNDQLAEALKECFGIDLKAIKREAFGNMK